MSTIGPSTPPPPYDTDASAPSTPSPPLTPLPAYMLRATPVARCKSTRTALHHPRHSTRLATLLVACFGTSAIDLVWFTTLNLLGWLLTLLQLPLALALAVQFSSHPPRNTQHGRTARVKQGEEDALMRFTQRMWDCHDWLEECELVPPSAWPAE